MKNDVNIALLKVTEENSSIRIRIRIGSLILIDTKVDLYPNVTDPQHRFKPLWIHSTSYDMYVYIVLCLFLGHDDICGAAVAGRLLPYIRGTSCRISPSLSASLFQALIALPNPILPPFRIHFDADWTQNTQNNVL